MKANPTLIAAMLVCMAGYTQAQVQIDKPIELTGGSGERMITGLELPTIGVDAANKDYVDAAVAAGGGGSSIPTEISNKSGAQMTYKDAVQYCDALVENTKDDWRLPSFNETTYFAGTTTDSDFLWTRTKSEYQIATNQNYVSTRLNDGSWSGGGIISRFLPRAVTSSTPTATGWATVLTVTPNVGDLLLLPNFRLQGGGGTCSSGSLQHQYTITFADGGTLTLGPYNSSTCGSSTHYTFTARDMEEAWQFGPIQQIVVQQNRTGTNQGTATIQLDAAYEIILTQADSGSGLYARCVR